MTKMYGSWLVPIALFVVGCGSGHYTVRGKVVFPDGKPMEGGWVNFEKFEKGVMHSADSPVEADGTFELRTVRPGDGVPPGTYRVLVKAQEVTLAEGQRRTPRIHPKYESFDTSGLEFTVEPKANFFEIPIKRVRSGECAASKFSKEMGDSPKPLLLLRPAWPA